MVKPCPVRWFSLLATITVLVLFLLPADLHAADKSRYFDFGPYYNSSNQQVLGLTFSSLENLPVPPTPPEAVITPAGGVLPGNFFYPFENLAENVQLILTFNPAVREELRLGFAQERLSEAKALLEGGNPNLASDAISSFVDTIKEVAQNASALSEENHPQAADLLGKLEDTTAANLVAASNLALTQPPAVAEVLKEAVSVSEQVLDTVADKAGHPPIPEELSVAIQTLKGQGLITPEESDKLYGLGSRGEVREELEKLTASGQFPPSEVVKLDSAVSAKFPDAYHQTEALLQFVELRSYQTLPPPQDTVLTEIKRWQEEEAGTPPPNDIRPYLYYVRAEELAKTVDLANFDELRQAEVARFYPQAVSGNPTYNPPPSPQPSPSPQATPAPGEPTVSPSPQSQPVPTPAPPTAEPYLTGVTGPVPGDPTYFFKRFTEEASLVLTFNTAAKAEANMRLAEERLREASAIAGDQGKAVFYQDTLKLYQSKLADASVALKNLPQGEESRELARKLEAQVARHEIVLETGLLPVPSDPKVFARVIEATQDAMDRSADALGRPALPPLLQDRLQDMKAQGLILPEEVDRLTKAGSREEVREEIRKLTDLGTFPPADAKKMDEAQNLAFPKDYNQLVEVRKVEELQNLRAVQTDLAQTPTLKLQASQLDQKASSLGSSFDPALIKREDLGGRENLIQAYEKLASIPRPINGGQFGAEATPGAQPEVSPPSPRDAVLTTCPGGATFKQSEGCVWADSGRKINDYDQYKCDGSRQYYSFAAKKCVASDPTKGYQEDAQPICPVGYTWSWPTQSCQTSRGGILPYPSPSAQPKPKDVEDVEELNKSCPEGSSFLPPSGCFWDDNGKSVYDPKQYRCSEGQYYSFEEHECVPIPKPGVPYPENTTPTCKAEGFYWNWSTGQCLPPPAVADEKPLGGPEIIDVKPTFVTPGSPFYFLKQAAEKVQQVTAFTPAAREQVSMAQAEERLAEAVDALKKNDQQGAKKAISAYTAMMQNLVGDLSKESLTEIAKNEISKRLSEGAVKQNLLLQKLQALAPAEQDAALSAATSVSILGVDKAADIAGELPIPDELKSKIEALPEKMISEEDKKALLEMDSRVDARLKLGGLIANGVLTQTEAGFLNEEFDKVDPEARFRVEELKRLEEIADASENREKLVEKVEKNEEISQKLAEFEKTFEVGSEVPAEIRPYVRLTRINEVAQTIRPDIVRLEDFQNRKDVVLAVATLQEEFKPTRESWAKVEDYRRRNPGAYLPPELARIEALSFSLGVRNQAGPCYLPTPPFAPNTPCPAPGAAIPITSYANYIVDIADRDFPVYGGDPTTDKDGKSFVYGQGPKPESAGACTDGYHWMYDSGGWCMSNSGNYSQSPYNYTPSGPQTPGYTPYSPYYNAPGTPPATYGYPSGGSFPGFNYSYSPPSYYGPGPTTYTTNPPPGTVPGSGPKPTASGQCPTGFHWMSDSGGWCMADGPTYVPPGGPNYPSGEYKCGSQGFNSATGRCNDGACPGGSNWDGSRCVAGGPSGGGSITPWCWSAFPPPGGWTCGSGSSWDQSSCSCKSTGSPGSGTGNCGSGYSWNGYSCQPSSGPGSNCTYPSGGCPGAGAWYDYSSCSCKTTSYNYPSGPTSPGSCYPPSGGCGSGWYDYSSCSCKQASSQGCYNVSASSCGSGWYWDSAACTCRQSSTPTTGGGGGGSCPSGSHWMSDNGGYCMSNSVTTSSGSTSTSTSGSGSSTGSCPSGYHWMSDNGGWCMSDGASSGSTTTTSPTPTETTSTPPPSEPAPTSSSPPPSEPAPPPSEPVPAPSP